MHNIAEPMIDQMTLAQRLGDLQQQRADNWAVTGSHSRPNLHSILRYPAMMVPSMQGDIIELLVDHVATPCRIVDTFVGSGTILTESLLRGLDFTGCDINPLAVLVCEAKIVIDAGANLDLAATVLLSALSSDVGSSVDVGFAGLAKWFTPATSQELSRIRRSILQVEDQGARKVFWTVFAETIRLCSNSRTSTYKLHARRDDSLVASNHVQPIFRENLANTLARAGHYQRLIQGRNAQPSAKVHCADVRSVGFANDDGKHTIVVTSPPYGDNQTTIPYGQFSYLALCWIPEDDLPLELGGFISNTHALDSASLGGSLRGAVDRADRIRGVSPSLDALLDRPEGHPIVKDLRKVASFMADFFDAMCHIRDHLPGRAHWAFTTGNRRAAGRPIPFDSICREMLCYLGARPVTSLRRTLPNKRMPSKNNMGEMITTENTVVVEFA
ncbi:hypothetical protein [Mesorhizobium amorphae]|uniref:hypothetical protein n=1 Tax=Mesorhizobium amorphae TaxID=71433 RepID=UPI00178227FB|nr:hypothetical protein [Mesorhizobium amorphae]